MVILISNPIWLAGKKVYDQQPLLSETGNCMEEGGADDGYSAFAAILSIKTCQAQKLDHPRYVIFLEADEEMRFAPLFDESEGKNRNS